MRLDDLIKQLKTHRGNIITLNSALQAEMQTKLKTEFEAYSKLLDEHFKLRPETQIDVLVIIDIVDKVLKLKEEEKKKRILDVNARTIEGS